MQACGDVPAAVVNAALGNLVGSAVAPALARVLIGGQSVGSNTGATAVKLLGQIFLPLAAGVATQLAARRFRPAAHARLRTSRASGAASGLLLFALMYLIFCKAFAGRGSELTARALGPGAARRVGQRTAPGAVRGGVGGGRGGAVLAAPANNVRDDRLAEDRGHGDCHSGSNFQRQQLVGTCGVHDTCRHV